MSKSESLTTKSKSAENRTRVGSPTRVQVQDSSPTTLKPTVSESILAKKIEKFIPASPPQTKSCLCCWKGLVKKDRLDSATSEENEHRRIVKAEQIIDVSEFFFGRRLMLLASLKMYVCMWIYIAQPLQPKQSRGAYNTPKMKFFAQDCEMLSSGRETYRCYYNETVVFKSIRHDD